MSNQTMYKYQRLYTINRNFNPEFDSWIQDRYFVTVGTKPWNSGAETFRDKSGGLKLDVHVMQEYVRAGGLFYATEDDWWDKKLSKGVRNVPKF